MTLILLNANPRDLEANAAKIANSVGSPIREIPQLRRFSLPNVYAYHVTIIPAVYMRRRVPIIMQRTPECLSKKPATVLLLPELNGALLTGEMYRLVYLPSAHVVSI